MEPERRGVSVPSDIARDPVQSAIWQDLAPSGDNDFSESDVPALRLLCYWHAVARQAQESMARGAGRIEVLDRIGTKDFEGEGGEREPLLRKSPAIGVLKEASAEIRALSDQLGISPRSRQADTEPSRPRSANASVLSMVLSDREAKARRAAGA